MTILKIKFNEDVRRFTLDTVPTFSELQQTLRGLFKNLPENFTVKYTDEEEDLISMCSDMEVKEAFDIAKHSPSNILRLSITADNHTAPFVVNQRDVSVLSANALRQLIDSPGFQQLITSPGFQQLLPAIIDSPGFQQQLVPQLLNPTNVQQLLPTLTNVPPAATTLFEAMIPMLLNASLEQQKIPAKAASSPSPATPPATPVTPTATPTQTQTQTQTPTPATTDTPSSPPQQHPVAEIKKDVVIDSKSFDCDSFEVVDITSSLTSISSTASSTTSLSESNKNVNSPATSATSIPPPPSSPEVQAPKIPDALAPFIATLVNMGFTDIPRNLQLLEEHQGNICRVIEICLGEGQN